MKPISTLVLRLAALPLVAITPLMLSADDAGAQIRKTFRLLEWNVSDSAWIKHRAETRAVLTHADPDVIVLLQVHKALTPPEMRKMVAGLRGPSDTTWFISSRPAIPTHEHEVVLSRDSIREIPEFNDLHYSANHALSAGSIPPDSEKTAANELTSELLRVNGVLAKVQGRWILLVPVHFTCCGDGLTWREYRRQFASSIVADRIRSSVKAYDPRAVIVAGDMNLVSGPAPIDTLLNMPMPTTLGAMKRAAAVRLDGKTDWTWDGRGTPFPQGRLDNVTYSSGTLSVAGARIWDTESMPADTLTTHSLAPDMSKTIGRHRPVVVDFSFSR